MNETDEVVAFLSQGASYGQPRARVDRIETHCSMVFLVGNLAYKWKRPIAFSALDYRTLEKREAACRAELELNRRTAPELYLAVQAIRRRDDGKLSFNGSAQILDWVVVMRRFDQADIFARIADSGYLSADLMRMLANEIARFHGIAKPEMDFGGAAGLRDVIARNYNEHRMLPAILAPEVVDSLHRTSLDRLAHVSETLDRRRDQGKVRRGHGDLRLANICLFDDRPTLFDAIEFCAAANCIDVLFDLAFLLVDLCQRKADSLANLAFNRYLDVTGDTESLAPLPLMLSIRAASRAYTMALAVPRQVALGEAQRVGAAARSFLTLASSLLEKPRPRLIALGGLSSRTKSFIAQDLAAALAPPPGARILRGDVMRKRLLGLSPRNRLPFTAYAPELTARNYAALRTAAFEALHTGFSAIVEASFIDASQRQAIAAVARDASAPFLGLWIGEPLAIEIGTEGEAWPSIRSGAAIAATVVAARTMAQAAFGIEARVSSDRGSFRPYTS